MRGKDERDWGILPRKETEYDDVVIVDYAIDFLENHSGDPFFLSVGTFHPHLPWNIPKRFHDLYAESEIQLPVVPENDLDDIPPIPREWAEGGRDEMQAARDSGEWEEAVRCYLASISFADAQVGRVLEALENSPFAKSTIVVLWSDHGFHLGEKGHWRKKTLWEEATRVPFIIATPGMKNSGQSSSRPVNIVSIFPTLASLLRLESDTDFDGPDLTPLLANPYAEWPHPSLIEFGYGNTAVRDERWRYIRYHDGTEELYDHQADPNEWKNLLSNDREKDRYNKVRGRLRKHLPKSWAKNALGKSAYQFDPERWIFTNTETGEIVPGNRPDQEN